MAAVDTRTQRNTLFGAFLAANNMTPETPIADPATFYDAWEDFLFRSQNPSATLPTVPAYNLPIASAPNPSARLGSAENPRVVASRRGTY